MIYFIWVWRHTLGIPALVRLKQKDHRLEATLGYTVSLLLVNKAYKDGARGSIGFNLTIRQSGPGTGQVSAAFSSWPVPCSTAQVAVCSKGLPGTVTHLEKTKRSKGQSPEKGSRRQLEPRIHH